LTELSDLVFVTVDDPVVEPPHLECVLPARYADLRTR